MAGKISSAVTKKEDKKALSIKDYVKMQESAIKAALPAVLTPERFTRMVMSAISSNPALGECTPKSFLAAMMQAAQLGLEPNTPLGQAYLIPFNNRKANIKECSFQIGYKGLIDLAYRSGDVSMIQAHEVRENDEFSYEFGLEPKLTHKPAMKDRGEVICYYAIFKTKSGGNGFEVMSVDDVKSHAEKYSQAFQKSSSPWTSNFDEMAKKTVLKKALKYAPLKSDFVKAVTSDETIKYDLSENMIDEPAIEVDYEPVGVDMETGEKLEDTNDPAFGSDLQL